MPSGALRVTGLAAAFFVVLLFAFSSRAAREPSPVSASPTAAPLAAAAREAPSATPTAMPTRTHVPTPLATATATAPPPQTPTATPTDTPVPAPSARAEPPPRGGQPERPPVTPPAPQPSADEQSYSLALLNKARAAHGLGPLSLDAAIAEAARRHAEEMAEYAYLAHVNRQGQQPWDRMKARRVGIAVARRDGWLYWVCDFAD